MRPDVAPTTQLIISDSVLGIQWVAQQNPPKIDLVYLDSYDLDVYNPIPSMVHGLAEFLWLKDLVKPGTLILIDDTPSNDEEWSRIFGKPMHSIAS